MLFLCCVWWYFVQFFLSWWSWWRLESLDQSRMIRGRYEGLPAMYHLMRCLVYHMALWWCNTWHVSCYTVLFWWWFCFSCYYSCEIYIRILIIKVQIYGNEWELYSCLPVFLHFLRLILPDPGILFPHADDVDDEIHTMNAWTVGRWKWKWEESFSQITTEWV